MVFEENLQICFVCFYHLRHIRRKETQLPYPPLKSEILYEWSRLYWNTWGVTLIWEPFWLKVDSTFNRLSSQRSSRVISVHFGTKKTLCVLPCHLWGPFFLHHLRWTHLTPLFSSTSFIRYLSNKFLLIYEWSVYSTLNHPSGLHGGSFVRRYARFCTTLLYLTTQTLTFVNVNHVTVLETYNPYPVSWYFMFDPPFVPVYDLQEHVTWFQTRK